MAKFMIKRLLSAIPTLFLAMTLIFLLMRAIPGNPLYMLAGATAEYSSAEEITQLEEKYGLGGSVFEQYGKYLRNIFSGDWGDSFYYSKPVFEVIAGKMEPTLMLTAISLLITVLIGVPIGIIGAVRKNSLIDYLCSAFSISFMIIPNFCLGILLIYVFGFRLQWFPISNYYSIGEYGILQAIYSILLPAFAVGMVNVANVARYTRGQMLSVLNRDYIRTARAKGLSETSVRYKHALKNAFPTVLTILSSALLGCLGGSVIIENVFNIQGVGRLVKESLSRQDYPLTQAIVLLMTAFFIVINILLDIGYKLLDPRVEFDK